MSPPAPIEEVVLPLLLPARAEGLWVADPTLAAALASAGYEVESGSPDVVVVRRAEELAAAPRAGQVVALVDGIAGVGRSGGRVVDAAVRLQAHARVRRQVARLRRRLVEEGRPAPEAWFWDIGSKLPVDREPMRAPVHHASRYQRRAALSSGGTGVTLLREAALAAARATGSAASGSGPVIEHVVVSEGSTVAITDMGVLRLALGSRVAQVAHPAAVLRSVRPVIDGGAVGAAAPELLATGVIGSLHWSLESFLDGGPVRPPLTDAQWRACVDLQVELRDLPADLLAPGPRLTALADTVAGLARDGSLVRRLASEAERLLEPLERGVNHGDFWHANLLGDGHGVTGLLDWDSARGRGVPFVDLLHLYTAAAERPGRHSWGRAFVTSTLPWLADADDRHLRSYAERIAVAPTAETLGAAAVGYWLVHMGYQLSRYPQRGADPLWVSTNIDGVATALHRFVRR